MISDDFFTAWRETRLITNQIADAMLDDNLNWKPHEEMNPFGKITSHLIGTIYYMFNNYLKRPVDYPETIQKKQMYNKQMFKQGLEDTNKLVIDLYKELTMDDLSNEAYTWEDKSYSIGWVAFNFITHERWTQAQLKMYLKLMGADTSSIGH